MAKITRKDLSVVYNAVCGGWQKRIDNILSNQKFSDDIDIEDKLVQQGWGEANADQRKLLSKYFDTPKSICDKIYNIDDVLYIVGETYEEVVRYKSPKTKRQRSQNAYALLQVISEAYNEGWTPDFTNTSQPKYYLYFERKPGAQGGWVVRGCSSYLSYASGGFGLYFETKEKALDAGKKFINVFNDYLPE